MTMLDLDGAEVNTSDDDDDDAWNGVRDVKFGLRRCRKENVFSVENTR